MGRAFSWRSVTFAAVLLVTGFEAITPDADDLASSMALRILGMQAATPGRSSDDDDADEAAGNPTVLENTRDMSGGLYSRPPRQFVIAPIPALSSQMLSAPLPLRPGRECGAIGRESPALALSPQLLRARPVAPSPEGVRRDRAWMSSSVPSRGAKSRLSGHFPPTWPGGAGPMRRSERPWHHVDGPAVHCATRANI